MNQTKSCDSWTRITDGCPNKYPEWNFNKFLLLVLDDHGLFLDLFDHGTSKDINLILLERGFSVLDQLLYRM